jgi:hypothetical protein
MILVDLQQVMIATLMVQLKGHYNIEIEDNLLRHMVLNCIRSYNHKFKGEYGEMVIACDSRQSWRRDVFPFYKAHRKKDRDKSELDWNMLFKVFADISNELKEFFPYRVIEVDGAEADDVIGVLCWKYGSKVHTWPLGQTEIKSEPILIVSGDKDFIQLQKYENVKQYDTVRNKWVNHNNPEEYLKEHIITGDRGDGVPNVLSQDDIFLIDGKRQTVLTKGRKSKLMEEGPTKEQQKNWDRNKLLVDLSCTPSDIKEQILDKYFQEEGKDKKKLFNYFIEYKLPNLMTSIQEF